MAAELNVAIKTLPYLATGKTTSVNNRSASTRQHFHNRDAYQAADPQRYAAIQGLDVKVASTDIDSEFPSKGLLAANDHRVGQEYAKRMFTGIWDDSIDSHNLEEVHRVLHSLEVADTLTIEKYGLEQSRSELEEMGVFTVPTCVLNGQVFVGRQHLPLIREILLNTV